MAKNKKQLRLYGLIYFGIAVLAFFGLIFNIKAQQINIIIQNLNHQVSTLEKENQLLEMALYEQTSLALIDEVATTQLDMGLPKTIHYIEAP